jgi:4-aminobutyrate aminotransferase
VACAAAMATIRLIRERLMQNAADVGAYLLAGVRSLMDKHAVIGEDRQTKERATGERDRVVRECFNRGLLVLGAGQNAIRLSPPLVLTREQADTAVRILDEALTAIAPST